MRQRLNTALRAALCAAALTAAAHAQGNPPPAPDTQAQEQIYGWQLMTQQERDAYRASMRNARTVEARQQIQAAHHAQMQQRAAERGVTLPDQPLRQPGAMRGSGQGQGQGRGAGQGAGSGQSGGQRQGAGGGSGGN
ncbi:MAG: hypothetical protein PHP86_01685 [Nevskiales bacterium]|nr:hypothetical protein [Nevskiales bacterium]